MTKLISIMNRKGGVGKTTLSIALAQTFIWEYKMNVLLLDLDPQASASEALLGDAYPKHVGNGPGQHNKSLESYLRSHVAGVPVALDSIYRGTSHGLRGRADCAQTIAPNSQALWDFEWEVLQSQRLSLYEEGVKSLIEEATSAQTTERRPYDIVIADCPPGRTVLSDEAIKHSALVICPVQPAHMAVWGMEQMKRYFDKMEPTPNWRFVVSMVQGGLLVDQSQVRAIEHQFSDRLLTKPGEIEPRFFFILHREAFRTRIARFREDANHTRTLEYHYGRDGAQRLRRIAQYAKREVGM